MKRINYRLYGVVLAAGALALAATGAGAQGRGRAASAGMAGGCPAGSSGSTGSTASSGTTTTGTSATTTASSNLTTTSAAAAYQNYLASVYGRSAVSGTSGYRAAQSYAASRAAQNQSANVLTAQATANGALLVRYNGATSGVRQVNFGLFNANNQAVGYSTVTQLPVQTQFAQTAGATHYGVQIVYQNGTTSTIYSPLR